MRNSIVTEIHHPTIERSIHPFPQPCNIG